MDNIPLSEAFNIDQLKASFRDADIIILANKNDAEHKACAFGKPLLNSIIKNSSSSKYVIVTVPIDFGEAYGDLELMIAMVKATKGREEYSKN